MTNAEKLTLAKHACHIRMGVIEGTHSAKCGHPGGSLDIAEVLSYLYFVDMNIDPREPKKPDRDRFVLSKGHAAPCYYAVLGERGFFDKAEFKNFRQLHSFLQGHPDAKKCPGVDASTGSLGQGISIAVGMALGAKKLDHSDVKVYTLLGDGELQEGQVWEAVMTAAQHKLDNLCAMVDYNRVQLDGTLAEIKDLGDLAAKWRDFGWNVIELDGHDIQAVVEAYRQAKVCKGKPTVLMANTIKGKGVSFMENDCNWHGNAPNAEQLRQALSELGLEGEQ